MTEMILSVLIASFTAKWAYIAAVWLPHKEEAEIEDDLANYYPHLVTKNSDYSDKVDYSMFKTLKFWIPLFSIVEVMMARRGESQNVSTRTEILLIECFFTITFILIFLLTGLSADFAYWALFITLLVVAYLVDWSSSFLPERLTNCILWTGLISAVLSREIGLDSITDINGSVLGCVIGYTVLKVFNMLHQKIYGEVGMAFGDLRLMGAIGAWVGTSMIIMVLFLSFLSAAFLCAKGRNRTHPFGPHIITWALLTVIVHKYDFALPLELSFFN